LTQKSEREFWREKVRNARRTKHFPQTNGIVANGVFSEN
jgi:hypothetical protein